MQTVTGGGAGVKKKPAAAAKAKKPAASNVDKEEPMERELSVSCTVNKHCIAVLCKCNGLLTL